MKKTIIQSLLLLSLGAGAAHADRQGLYAEPIGSVVSSTCAVAPGNEIFNEREGKGELEKARLNDEELARVKGRALDPLIPDIQSSLVAGVTLWDEVKAKRSATVSTVTNGEGQFIGTIIQQGR